MGTSFSCPFSTYSNDENSFESILVKSISFGDDEIRTPVGSVSFNTQEWEPTLLKSLSFGKMIIEGSVSFKGNELERMISIKSPSSENEKNVSGSPKSKEMENDQSPRSEIMSQHIPKLNILDPSNPKHEAAIKLQKVYKSFRTRRKLADCAVLVEQSWWKLLDFAELKQSSISFFDIEKHESAISRWSRARTRAAKVGKGLCKNDKAQKLALQHWLEAIDPRHRYGHNLQFYFVKWRQCQSREPFFYWLDIGEGKEVNIVEKCPRSKLQQQCIKYLGPMERKVYEVVVKDGKLLYKQTEELLHTTEDEAKWIFVLCTSNTLYVGKKKKGTFQHSSFLAGGATSAAGRLVAENGILKAVWPHSGHYKPTRENFKDFILFLRGNNVDLADVKMSPVDEEEGSISKRSNGHLRNNSSDEDFIERVNDLENEEINVDELGEEKINAMEHETVGLSRKLTDLDVPKMGEVFERCESENLSHGYETAEAAASASEQDYKSLMHNLFGQEHEETEVETIPEESILQRINSHKETNSYQLGKQLSCKWTTGAGPRIGCVRDYPSELQFRALELVSLSPRSACPSRSYSSPLSPKALTPSCSGGQSAAIVGSPELDKKTLSQGSIYLHRVQSSPLWMGKSLTDKD